MSAEDLIDQAAVLSSFAKAGALIRTFGITGESNLLGDAASELCGGSQVLLAADGFWDELANTADEHDGWELIERLHESQSEFLTWELDLLTSGEHADPMPYADAFELLSALGDAIERAWMMHSQGVDGLGIATEIELVRNLFGRATEGICTFHVDDDPKLLMRSYQMLSRHRWRVGGFGSAALNGLALASIVANPFGIFGAGSVLAGLLVGIQGSYDED